MKLKSETLFMKYFTIGKSLVSLEFKKWNKREKPRFKVDNQVWNDTPPERIIDIRWHLPWHSVILRIEMLLSQKEAEAYGYNWERGMWQKEIEIEAECLKAKAEYFANISEGNAQYGH